MLSDLARKTRQQNGRKRHVHGEGYFNNTTPEYRSWHGMKARCYTKSHAGYERYGGRGIRVCKRWIKSYLNFLQDMGRKPDVIYTIDRIDNDGNYTPTNCRWATPKQQSANRRNSRRNQVKTDAG